MKKGPITPRGKAKSAKNAIKHGLSGKLLHSNDDKAQYDKIYQELVDEYNPQNTTEYMLINRVAVNYVRWQRTIRAESAEIELANHNSFDQNSMKELFNLTSSQSKRLEYLLANLQDTTPTIFDEDRLHQLQELHSEVSKIINKGHHNTIPADLPESQQLAHAFENISKLTGHPQLELLDGTFHEASLINSIINKGTTLPEKIEHTQTNEHGKSIGVLYINISPQTNGFFDNLLLVLDEEITIQTAFLKAMRLQSLSDQLGIGKSTNLEKLSRYITSTDRQFSKSLGELRVVVEARERREALTFKT